MVQIAAKDQCSSELTDEANSRNLSRSPQPGPSFAESSQVAFVGYVAWRSEENGDSKVPDEQVFVVRAGQVRPLPIRTDLASHSPEGVSWGYCGIASAQLALAMLMEVLNDWPPVRCIYHDFHALFVRKIPRAANWTADGADILAWALELETRLPNSP